MEFIKQIVDKLINEYKTNDPFEIADYIGLNVVFADLGNLKGMYKYIKRNRYAVINENLDKRMSKIVCAHELGHDRLHMDFAKHQFLQEFMLYDMKSRPEYEANLFAAELLITDKDLYQYAILNYDIYQISAILNTDVNLVAIKSSAMNLRGYKFNDLDFQDDFLGKY